MKSTRVRTTFGLYTALRFAISLIFTVVTSEDEYNISSFVYQPTNLKPSTSYAVSSTKFLAEPTE